MSDAQAVQSADEDRPIKSALSTREFFDHHYGSSVYPDGFGAAIAFKVRGQPGLRQEWFGDSSSMAERADVLARRDDVEAVYHSVSLFRPQKNGEYRRTAELAAGGSTIAIDLDCGEGKPFASQLAAAQAARDILKAALGLEVKDLTIVSSGGGIHCWRRPKTEPLIAVVLIEN